MIERPMHAFEEGADIASIVAVTKRQCRLVEAGVGPLILGGKSLQLSLHGCVSSPKFWPLRACRCPSRARRAISRSAPLYASECLLPPLPKVGSRGIAGIE